MVRFFWLRSPGPQSPCSPPLSRPPPSLATPSHTQASTTADPAFAYIRVKRRRSTVFLKVDPPTDTVAAVLGRLADLLQQV